MYTDYYEKLTQARDPSKQSVCFLDSVKHTIHFLIDYVFNIFATKLSDVQAVRKTMYKQP